MSSVKFHQTVMWNANVVFRLMSLQHIASSQQNIYCHKLTPFVHMCLEECVVVLREIEPMEKFSISLTRVLKSCALLVALFAAVYASLLLSDYGYHIKFSDNSDLPNKYSSSSYNDDQLSYGKSAVGDKYDDAFYETVLNRLQPQICQSRSGNQEEGEMVSSSCKILPTSPAATKNPFFFHPKWLFSQLPIANMPENEPIEGLLKKKKNHDMPPGSTIIEETNHSIQTSLHTNKQSSSMLFNKLRARINMGSSNNSFPVSNNLFNNVKAKENMEKLMAMILPVMKVNKLYDIIREDINKSISITLCFIHSIIDTLVDLKSKFTQTSVVSFHGVNNIFMKS
jgi:hypothetical protein